MRRALFKNKQQSPKEEMDYERNKAQLEYYNEKKRFSEINVINAAKKA